MNILLLDNYDSFTYNLYDYLCRLGVNCTVYYNDSIDIDFLKKGVWHAIVLSPGPKRPKDAGILMDCIAYFHDKLPILGVCLGHQALGEFFGAKLVHAPIAIHGKINTIHHTGKNLFENIAQPMPVMRYHSLILKDLPTCLTASAYTEDGLIMALEHKDLPLYGVQFHPESIGTPQGLNLLDNWLNLVKKQHNIENTCSLQNHSL